LTLDRSGDGTLENYREGQVCRGVISIDLLQVFADMIDHRPPQTEFAVKTSNDQGRIDIGFQTDRSQAHAFITQASKGAERRLKNEARLRRISFPRASPTAPHFNTGQVHKIRSNNQHPLILCRRLSEDATAK
jgi:hypothetical protein